MKEIVVMREILRRHDEIGLLTKQLHSAGRRWVQQLFAKSNYYEAPVHLITPPASRRAKRGPLTPEQRQRISMAMKKMHARKRAHRIGTSPAGVPALSLKA